jgi:hypothetical protein
VLVWHHLVSLAAAFDSVTLQRYAVASSLSYLSLEKMTKSEYFLKSQLQPLAQVVDPVSESGATIFSDKSSKNKKNHRLVVACRGSANAKNFGTNLNFNLVPATRLSESIPDGAFIHEGFQNASVGLWRELAYPLLSKIQEEGDLSEIVFTGHSLGAATALLTSVHYTTTKESLLRPTIITFGGPKFANDILARFLRNDVLDGCCILHLIHDRDPVLANNQQLWKDLGFVDVGIELGCDANIPTVYFDQDKKPKSMFSFAWNILDHCNYMGVSVGPRL